MPSGEASARTIHRRSNELQSIRTTISKDASTVQFEAEVKALSQEDQQQLLKSAEITTDIPPEQGLAMKAHLAIPWNRLRIIRMYIRNSIGETLNYISI